jgi:hypothetical protein
MKTSVTRWGIALVLVGVTVTALLLSRPSSLGDLVTKGSGAAGSAPADLHAGKAPIASTDALERHHAEVGSTGAAPEKTRTLRGIVVTQSGNPIAMAGVIEGANVGEVATTDSEGRFTLQVQERSDTDTIQALAQHPSYGYSVGKLQYGALANPDQIMELRMQSGSALSVVVTDEAGTPVADAWVEIGFKNPEVSGGILIGGADQRAMHMRSLTLNGIYTAGVLTDGFGSASLGGLASGKYDVEVRHRAYESKRVKEVAVSGRDDIHLGTIALSPGRRLTGSVMLANGQGANGASVEMLTHGGGIEYISVIADASGEFIVDGIRASAEIVDLRVTHPGGQTVYENELAMEESRHVRITMPARQELSLRLTTQGNTPLVQSKVQVEWVAGSGGEKRSWLESVCSPSGKRDLLVRERGGVVEYYATEVPGGMAAAQVVCPGHYRAMVDLVEWGNAKTLTVAMTPGSPSFVKLGDLGQAVGREVTVSVGRWGDSGGASYYQTRLQVVAEADGKAIRIDPSEVAWGDGLSVEPEVEGWKCDGALLVKQPGQPLMTGWLAVKCRR